MGDEDLIPGDDEVTVVVTFWVSETVESHKRLSLTINCLLFIAECLLFIVNCLLFIADCLLFIVNCLLFIADCLLFIVNCLLSKTLTFQIPPKCPFICRPVTVMRR